MSTVVDCEKSNFAFFMTKRRYFSDFGELNKIQAYQQMLFIYFLSINQSTNQLVNQSIYSCNWVNTETHTKCV